MTSREVTADILLPQNINFYTFIVQFRAPNGRNYSQRYEYQLEKAKYRLTGLYPARLKAFARRNYFTDKQVKPFTMYRFSFKRPASLFLYLFTLLSQHYRQSYIDKYTHDALRKYSHYQGGTQMLGTGVEPEDMGRWH